MARRAMRAGWYADPTVPERSRFWDGQGWTRWLAAKRSAAFPPARDPDPVVPVDNRADQLLRVLRWVLAVVIVLAVVATVLGVVINRREASQHPATWYAQNTPAPTVSRAFEYPFAVNDQGTIDLGQGAASAQVPGAPWKSDAPAPIEAMFDQAVLSSMPGSARAGGLDAFQVVGVLHWIVLPANREATAAGLAQLGTARLFGKIPGVSHEQPETAELNDFGPLHPGATATMRVTWPGGGTVVVARIVQIADGAWLGWLASQGAELSDNARAAEEAAWRKTSFRDR